MADTFPINNNKFNFKSLCFGHKFGLTVDWETKVDYSAANINIKLSSARLSVTFTNSLHIFIFCFPICFDGIWRIDLNKKKYQTRITARATSLYELHYDLGRQIVFWSVFLSEGVLRTLHPEGGVDISDDKLILLLCHLHLVTLQALPSSSCLRAFVYSICQFFVFLLYVFPETCAAIIF